MNDLTPSQKGAVAEAAITAAAVQLGLLVLRPVCEGGRYDLGTDLDPALLRVQCKFARLLDGVLNRCFLLPIDEVAGRRSVHLRFDPTKNNQAERIKWARDYEFSTVMRRLKEAQAEPVGR
jgi:PD-(D/E)XK endonuclease